MAGGVLVVVGLTEVLVPLANAAISRRSEYAADRFAADHGLAIELAAALRVLDDDKRAPRGWSRLLSTHPTAEQRIRALQDDNRRPAARRRIRSPYETSTSHEP